MVCSNILLLKIIYFLNLAINILRFVVPIILIFKLILDLYKGMISPDLKKEFIKTSFNRIISCVIVFLVPTFISLIVSFIENVLETEIDYLGCLDSATLSNIKYLEERELSLEEEENQTIKNEAVKKYNSYIEEQKKYVKSNSSSSSNEGVSIGQKYNLSNTELSNLAKICYCEQGSITGAQAEASLMANRYELLKSSSKYYGKGLYNYVMNSGWWHPTKSESYKTKNISDEELNAIRNVLVNGYRTLPFYIDEHDYRGDISKIVTNGKTYTSSSYINKNSNYIKDKTIIYNEMGAKYTFYTFPTEKSDPFGYTDDAIKKYNNLKS